jgi:uncharacterized NAD-dependent epimerase/dehydratase family protein
MARTGDKPPSVPEISDLLKAHLEGKLSVNEYLDAQVEQAVAHLVGAVSSGRLRVIKETLREHIVQSPNFVELLKRAGVQLPDPRTAPRPN